MYGVNGSKIETLSTYAGDMQNSADQMKYFVGKNGTTFGTISLTDTQLTTAADIKAFTTPALPPFLSLLDLAAPADRCRRRK